jgi:hypothetical protein
MRQLKSVGGDDRVPCRCISFEFDGLIRRVLEPPMQRQLLWPMRR